MDLVAGAIPRPPHMGGLGETAALPPPCWRHQELLPRGAASLLGRRQSHNTHGTSVTASSCRVEELYLAQPGGRGVAGARAGRTRDPALTCHEPFLPGTRAPAQEAVAFTIQRPVNLESIAGFITFIIK